MNKQSKKFYLDPILDSMDADSLIEGIARITEINFHQDFIVQDIGISSRVLNHWDKKGLMPLKLRIGNGKYTFNFVEFIWFHIVNELRDYGFPLEKIKPICTALMKSFDCSEYFRNLSQKEKTRILKRIDDVKLKSEDEKKKLAESVKEELDEIMASKGLFYTNILSVLINEFLLYRKDVRILVDINGQVIPFSEKLIENIDFEKQKKYLEFDDESYISISLIKFFRKFIVNKSHFNFLCESNILNENEAHILSLVRAGKAKSITIKFRDQKPDTLEITKEKKIDADARISEVILGRGYQDISVKTENGNIVVSNIITKEKLKKI